MSHRIEFSPEALADLLDLYDYIAPRAGAARTIGDIDRIQDFCHSLLTFPERETRRDDLRPGLRKPPQPKPPEPRLGAHVQPR